MAQLEPADPPSHSSSQGSLYFPVGLFQNHVLVVGRGSQYLQCDVYPVYVGSPAN